MYFLFYSRMGDRDMGRRENDDRRERDGRDSVRFERREDRYQPRIRDDRDRRGLDDGYVFNFAMFIEQVFS